MTSKKVTSKKHLIVIVLLLSFVLKNAFWGCITSEAKQEKKTSYIVITKNKAEFKEIKKEYSSVLNDNRTALLKEENILEIKLTNDEKKKLSVNSNIRLIEEDVFVQGTNISNNTKKEIKQKLWNLESIRASSIKRKNQKTPKIKVALLDSGVDCVDSIDVKEKINLIENEETSLLYEDYSSHGTIIAGIMCANYSSKNTNIQGVNPNIELYSARILDKNCQAPISRVIEGIYWAIEKRVDIINISFGTNKYSKTLETAIKDANDAGILVIAAVGNQGHEQDSVEYPAAFEDVLGVGSVDSKGKKSDYSSTGTGVDVMAPGEAICSIGAFDEEMISSGTSMSVPHVVGIASLLWEKDLSKSNDFIQELIKKSARNLGDTQKYGNGLVDYDYAQKCYSILDQQFKQGKKIDVKQNDNKILKFDNKENEDKVAGSWYHDIHTAIFKNEGSAGSLKAMKEGAHYPDTTASGVKGMTNNPDFHGYYYRDSDKSYVNYMASYRYILRMGNSYGKGNRFAGVSGSNIPGLTKKSENAIYKAFIGMDAKINTYNDPSDKKAFVYGIAMHSASDVLAHSTFRYSNGSWKRITHPDADNPNVQKRRVTMAKRIERNVLYRFKGKRKDVPVAHDFHAAGDKSGEFYVSDTKKQYYRVARLLYNANQMKVSDSNVLRHYSMLNITK